MTDRYNGSARESAVAIPEAKVDDNGIIGGADKSVREVDDETEVDQELFDRLTRRSAEVAGKPLKHTIAALRRSKHPFTMRFIEIYDRQHRLRKEARLQYKKEQKREQKAAERATPEAAVEVERRKRRAALERTTKYKRGDKLIQQLLGREAELSLFWAAGRLSALATQPRAPSDTETAVVFTRLSGRSCSRHQARSKRQIVEQLNQHPGVWLPLEVSSDLCSAH